MLRYRLADDRGSLPIAMLAVLVVAALVSVVLSSVVTGQRQTRFDESFEQALQIAEVGLERMVALVESREASDSFTICAPPAGCPVDGGQYWGQAVKDSADDWTIQAHGRANDGTERSLQAVVDVRSLFNLAAFGKFFTDFNGGNGADSYRSGSWDLSVYPRTFTQSDTGSNICKDGTPLADPSLSSDVRMCTPTYNGVVATNGELFLKGGAFADTDYVEIHYARERISDPLPDATGFCEGVPDTCAPPYETECDVRGGAKLQYCRDPIVLPSDPVTPPSAPIGAFDGANGATLPAGVRVYTNVTLRTSTVIQGTPTNPTILYVTGKLTIPNHEHVNFRTNAAGNKVPRPSPSLLIFSSGSGPALDFGNHASLAGAVYAPRAGFTGGAQGNVYGSMIAGSINNNGGWNFHYDEALAEVTVGAPLQASDWTEL
ncbi:MAG: hypothetical protein M3N52_13805 [Actinomycetota bacterium]|nr:hypothetical protein [Actinomycetota bacterium]